MKHMPQFAFYAAMAVLLAGALIQRSAAAPEHSRVAVSLAFESGHLDFKAELGASLLALKL